MRRRQFLVGLGAAGAAGATALVATRAFAVEPNRVTVTRHRLRSPDGGGRGPARAHVRLLQLTDLHLRDELGVHERRVAARVNALRPDVVLVTGDAIEAPAGLELLDHFLQMLDPSIPKVATVGNWEIAGRVDPETLARLYARHNGRLLRNASARLMVNDAELLLTGLDDEVTGRPDARTALAGAAPCRNHLLLAHCPATRDRLPRAWGATARDATARDASAWGEAATRSPAAAPRRRPPDGELAPFTPVALLAGHTHGGQIAPFGVAPWRPPGSGRYLRGWYRDDGALPLYVSVGLGTTLLPARLGTPPEVAVFDWEVGS